MVHDDETQELAQIEQSLEQFLLQKKQFHAQLTETTTAHEAAKDSREAYKIIGNLMIKLPSEKLLKDLEEKQETLRVRIQTIEKQEEKLRAQLKEKQESLMKRQKKK